MNFSNTSLNTYAACQRKFWHNYINHSPKCKPDPLYFAFGEMAHKVLYDAGILRDNTESGDIETYDTVIPSELMYHDLKEEFGIKNWHSYFTQVCKQVVQYEREEIKILCEESGTDCELYREYEITELFDNRHPVKGIIDLLIISKDRQYATILDYKFSSKQKTQDDFDMNSQLQIYAELVNKRFNVPLRNIRIGYIDIVRSDFERPIVLNNGTLSRAKSQNVSQETYIACVKALEPERYEAMLAPGGYYYEIVQELANKKIAYLNTQWLDIDAHFSILNDTICVMDDLAQKLDKENKEAGLFNARFDAYTCKGCEFLKACKPWITIEGGLK